MNKFVSKSKSLSSFNVMPNAYFAEIDADEQTVLMLRAHPITLVPWIFNTIIGIFAILAFDIFLASLLSFRIVFRVNLIGLILVLAYAWYNFLIWYYTVGFVTTKRIIDIDYYGLVKRVVSQAPMIKLSDVTAKVAGFFGQILNYGNVFVTTEGTTQNIEFLDIPYPDEAVAIINDVGTDAAHPNN